MLPYLYSQFKEILSWNSNVSNLAVIEAKTRTGFHGRKAGPVISPKKWEYCYYRRGSKISISSQSWVKDSPRFCLSQANSFLWCSLYFRTAKQSNVDLSCLHLYRQGKIFLLPFSITYCMSFLLFTWRFCLLLQVWNYLLLLGICALFKKRALFFYYG